eukprot:CAMPEP_0172495164 /NCGR_PEP_ID=MMETSP1066-20121228/64187_1 /TAXON_ID=671091 /ORGANISM="Coscinodiscus wailesii, Strain CCMP2513" /LENGTH=282 /DNA_ID=CAMNT_0013266655 /DNA_START=236 /DNA_END=1084 /DNA_ORIENTATION=+
MAVSTATIFRGLRVGKDGSVTSLKMKGQVKARPGGKSRQAAKIDKAKDLIEAKNNNKNVRTRGAAGDNDDDPSNVISLFIMGEYDDMIHLVRDGSKKLKSAEGLPDEILLALNRERCLVSGDRTGPIASPSSSRRRDDTTESRTAATTTTPDIHHYSLAAAKKKLPARSTRPPKLKCHPRDTTPKNGMMATALPSPRRRNISTSSVPQYCNELPIFGRIRGDSFHWSDTFGLSKGLQSIWNCGVEGANNGVISPDPTIPANDVWGDKGGVEQMREEQGTICL